MPASFSPEAQSVAEILRTMNRFLVAAHGNPDADAAGATAAMGYLLRALGKEFALYNGTGLPSQLGWLALPAPVHTRLATLPFKPRLVLALDCGDAWRLGNELAEALPRFASVNIDHHLGNPAYGSLANWIDPGMAATGQMVATLADLCEVPLQGPLAEGIYLSLVGDTGSFTHGNTTAAVHRLAARLFEAGLDAASLRNRLDTQWTLEKTRLWGRLMQSLRLEAQGRVGVVLVPQALFASFGTTKEDLEGFVEQIRRVQGVRVAALIREDGSRRSKISLRSTGDDDVRVVAARFGGGGHKNAAGATVELPPEETLRLLLETLHPLWSEGNADQ